MDEATPGQILAYMKDKEVDYPVIHDPDSRIAQQYAIRGVPSSFIVDADGTIRFVEVGYTTGIGLRFRLWWAGLQTGTTDF
jgi:alkyl hydroperoxide reductase subunit AhpC